jgi:hypothetical protein
LKEKADIVPKSERILYRCQIKYGLSTYFFDTYRYTGCFSDNFKTAFSFCDVTVMSIKAIVKSCPTNYDNVNSVVLNLYKLRRSVFLKDKKSFESKK